MKIDLTDKVVLITGATGGIGTAIARQFTSCRASLILAYKSDKNAAEKLLKKIFVKKLKLFNISYVCFVLFYAQTTFAQVSDKYQNNWNDPETQQRIEDGIQQNRMGWCMLSFMDKNWEPVNNVEASIEQLSHDFLFGANIFMLKGFDKDSENLKYEDGFTQLFNYASVPFYWADLEPVPGKIRFGADSKFIYRRPPPDLVVQFCKEKGIVMKGHTLIWDNPQWSLPAWLPRDAAVIEKLTNKRIGEIALRYGNDIMIWDVANEVTTRDNYIVMPNDFAFKAFKESERLFPGNSTFVLNFSPEIFSNYKGEYSADYLLCENMLLRGAKLDAIGLQFHIFSEKQHQATLEGKDLTPVQIFRVLDQYANLNKPLHITEITIPTLGDNEAGRKSQATLTRNFYRLWFSHPKVEAITWWNLVDKTAAPSSLRPDGSSTSGEDKWNGGLLNRDFSPKPSFQVLNELINKEWHTSISANSVNQPFIKFHGFYGKYQLRLKYKGKTVLKQVHFSKTGESIIKIVLD